MHGSVSRFECFVYHLSLIDVNYFSDLPFEHHLPTRSAQAVWHLLSKLPSNKLLLTGRSKRPGLPFKAILLVAATRAGWHPARKWILRILPVCLAPRVKKIPYWKVRAKARTPKSLERIDGLVDWRPLKSPFHPTSRTF